MDNKLACYIPLQCVRFACIIILTAKSELFVGQFHIMVGGHLKEATPQTIVWETPRKNNLQCHVDAFKL